MRIIGHRRRSGEGAKVREESSAKQVPIWRGAWYADPFGTAAERWWDGSKWTDVVRGPTKKDAAESRSRGELINDVGDAVPQHRVMAAGWYPWDADSMRYWDGTKWGETRKRVGAEVRPREPNEQGVGWLVRLGYVFAVLFPVLGFALAIIVATRPGGRANPRHGVQVIVLSIVVFVIGVLLSQH
jgi:hypothetical protein